MISKLTTREEICYCSEKSNSWNKTRVFESQINSLGSALIFHRLQGKVEKDEREENEGVLGSGGIAPLILRLRH
jgi:hypothetical protein